MRYEDAGKCMRVAGTRSIAIDVDRVEHGPGGGERSGSVLLLGGCSA